MVRVRKAPVGLQTRLRLAAGAAALVGWTLSLPAGAETFHAGQTPLLAEVPATVDLFGAPSLRPVAYVPWEGTAVASMVLPPRKPEAAGGEAWRQMAAATPSEESLFVEGWSPAPATAGGLADLASVADGGATSDPQPAAGYHQPLESAASDWGRAIASFDAAGLTSAGLSRGSDSADGFGEQPAAAGASAPAADAAGPVALPIATYATAASTANQRAVANALVELQGLTRAPGDPFTQDLASLITGLENATEEEAQNLLAQLTPQIQFVGARNLHRMTDISRQQVYSRADRLRALRGRRAVQAGQVVASRQPVEEPMRQIASTLEGGSGAFDAPSMGAASAVITPVANTLDRAQPVQLAQAAPDYGRGLPPSATPTQGRYPAPRTVPRSADGSPYPDPGVSPETYGLPPARSRYGSSYRAWQDRVDTTRNLPEYDPGYRARPWAGGRGGRLGDRHRRRSEYAVFREDEWHGSGPTGRRRVVGTPENNRFRSEDRWRRGQVFPPAPQPDPSYGNPYHPYPEAPVRQGPGPNGVTGGGESDIGVFSPAPYTPPSPAAAVPAAPALPVVDEEPAAPSVEVQSDAGTHSQPDIRIERFGQRPLSLPEVVASWPAAEAPTEGAAVTHADLPRQVATAYGDPFIGEGPDNDALANTPLRVGTVERVASDGGAPLSQATVQVSAFEDDGATAAPAPSSTEAQTAAPMAIRQSQTRQVQPVIAGRGSVYARGYGAFDPHRLSEQVAEAAEPLPERDAPQGNAASPIQAVPQVEPAPVAVVATVDLSPAEPDRRAPLDEEPVVQVAERNAVEVAVEPDLSALRTPVRRPLVVGVAPGDRRQAADPNGLLGASASIENAVPRQPVAPVQVAQSPAEADPNGGQGPAAVGSSLPGETMPAFTTAQHPRLVPTHRNDRRVAVEADSREAGRPAPRLIPTHREAARAMDADANALGQEAEAAMADPNAQTGPATDTDPETAAQQAEMSLFQRSAPAPRPTGAEARVRPSTRHGWVKDATAFRRYRHPAPDDPNFYPATDLERVYMDPDQRKDLPTTEVVTDDPETGIYVPYNQDHTPRPDPYDPNGNFYRERLRDQYGLPNHTGRDGRQTSTERPRYRLQEETELQVNENVMSSFPNSGVTDDTRWGLFLDYNYEVGSAKDITSGIPDAQISSHVITGGVDFQISPQLFTGLALTIGQRDAGATPPGTNSLGTLNLGLPPFDDDSTEIDSKIFMASLFLGAEPIPGLTIDAVGGGGIAVLDQYNFYGYRSEYEADLLSMGARVAYTYEPARNLSLVPSARIDYSRVDMEGYEENGVNRGFFTFVDDGFNIAAGDYVSDDLIGTLGFDARYLVEQANGVILSPYLSVDYRHRLNSDASGVELNFEGDDRVTFEMNPNDPQRQWVELGAGVDMRASRFLSGFVAGTAIVGSQQDELYGVSGGVRVNF